MLVENSGSVDVMRDFLAQIWSLIPEEMVCAKWLTMLLVLLSAYALGYVCGILPSLLDRKARKKLEQSAVLYEEILGKICEYDELYNRYIREINHTERTLLAGQITSIKEDLKRLQLRLAILERRQFREVPLRPLPVRQLTIDNDPSISHSDEGSNVEGKESTEPR